MADSKEITTTAGAAYTLAQAQEFVAAFDKFELVVKETDAKYTQAMGRCWYKTPDTVADKLWAGEYCGNCGDKSRTYECSGGECPSCIEPLRHENEKIVAEARQELIAARVKLSETNKKE